MFLNHTEASLGKACNLLNFLRIFGSDSSEMVVVTESEQEQNSQGSKLKFHV